jgi:hypothetical protein
MLNKKLTWTHVYKIKRKSDGLFKDKGFNNNFSKDGTTWLKIGHVRNHIAQNKNNLVDCVLCGYVLDQISQETI